MHSVLAEFNFQMAHNLMITKRKTNSIERVSKKEQIRPKSNVKKMSEISQ